MVKLVVKKAFKNKEDLSEMFEVGQEIEVTEVRAKDIQDKLPGYTEEVKPAKATPKKTTRKPKASKNEDDA